MKNLSGCFKVLLTLVLCLSLSSCGTIMHPERRGQMGGRLDVGVVLLDGVGLFFFIIPGIIAYAVDFSDGTIYLPHTYAKNAGHDRSEFEVVKFDAKHCTPESLRNIIRANTGYDLAWQDARLQTIRIQSKDEMSDYFAASARQN